MKSNQKKEKSSPLLLPSFFKTSVAFSFVSSPQPSYPSKTRKLLKKTETSQPSSPSGRDLTTFQCAGVAHKQRTLGWSQKPRRSESEKKREKQFRRSPYFCKKVFHKNFFVIFLYNPYDCNFKALNGHIGKNP